MGIPVIRFLSRSRFANTSCEFENSIQLHSLSLHIFFFASFARFALALLDLTTWSSGVRPFDRILSFNAVSQAYCSLMVFCFLTVHFALALNWKHQVGDVVSHVWRILSLTFAGLENFQFDEA
jgi:hypothetical protein